MAHQVFKRVQIASNELMTWIETEGRGFVLKTHRHVGWSPDFKRKMGESKHGRRGEWQRGLVPLRKVDGPLEIFVLRLMAKKLETAHQETMTWLQPFLGRQKRVVPCYVWSDVEFWQEASQWRVITKYSKLAAYAKALDGSSLVAQATFRRDKLMVELGVTNDLMTVFDTLANLLP